jgi:hypothetical protein
LWNQFLSIDGWNLLLQTLNVLLLRSGVSRKFLNIIFCLTSNGAGYLSRADGNNR